MLNETKSMFKSSRRPDLQNPSNDPCFLHDVTMDRVAAFDIAVVHENVAYENGVAAFQSLTTDALLHRENQC